MELSSVGFSLVGTKNGSLGLWICIFSDELNPVCNKYLTFFPVVIDYPRLILESVQKCSLLMEISSSCLNNGDTLTDNAAAISSSLDMETGTEY